MGQMDERMKNMQTLHDRMMSATTPEERQRVMDEQRKEMQGSMGMMNQMMQGGATTGGMGAGMMGRQDKPADAGAQMQMMQKRMDMMQMMMQTMMDQQAMMAGPRSLDGAPRILQAVEPALSGRCDLKHQAALASAYLPVS